eukprot:scaffold1143_cov177-Amphora_coffeaeformis.AAC.23
MAGCTDAFRHQQRPEWSNQAMIREHHQGNYHLNHDNPGFIKPTLEWRKSHARIIHDDDDDDDDDDVG